MPDINLLKNNIVITKVFNVDCDSVIISDVAKVGNIYDPITDTFKQPAPPAQPTPPEPPPQEGGNPEESEF